VCCFRLATWEESRMQRSPPWRTIRPLVAAVEFPFSTPLCSASSYRNSEMSFGPRCGFPGNCRVNCMRLSRESKSSRKIDRPLSCRLFHFQSGTNAKWRESTLTVANEGHKRHDRPWTETSILTPFRHLGGVICSTAVSHLRNVGLSRYRAIQSHGRL